MKPLILALSVFLTILAIPASTTAGVSHELSVAAAVELGLTHNLDIALANFRVEEARADLTRQRIVGDEEEIAVAEDKLVDALDILEQAQVDLTTQIENSYYDILTAEARLAELLQNLEDAQSNYRIEQARYQAGMISQLSLERTRNSVFNTELNAARQRDNLDTSVYRFQDLLGISLQDTVVLTDTIDLTYRPLTMTFDGALETALVHAAVILAAQESLADAAEAVRLADNSYTPRAALEKARMDQRRAEVNYEKAENRVFFDVRSAYLRVAQVEASIDLLRRELDYAQRNLQVVQAQHADGVVSDSALANAERAVESAETDLSDALWDHVRAHRDLVLAIGQPAVEWGD